MRRRTWIRLALAAVVAVPAIVASTEPTRGRIGRNLRRLDRFEGFGRDPKSRLRQHYDWLDVDPAAFDKYLADYQRYFGQVDRFSILRPDFYTKFLLSTDFFLLHAGRPANAKPVKYLAFYDPEVTACFNPVARRPPTDTELGRA